MERWESLQTGAYGIYQDASLGRFTEDPVRLVHFMRAGVRDVCADLGTGNGVIAIYANALFGCAFKGVDTDKEQLRLARLSAEKNGQNIGFFNCDVREAPERLGNGIFSVCTCNPPYFHGGTAPEKEKRRQQRYCESAEPFIGAAEKLLKNGGRLYLCYPAEGLAGITFLLQKHGLEPKRMLLTCRKNKAHRLFLEAKKGAAPGVSIELG